MKKISLVAVTLALIGSGYWIASSYFGVDNEPAQSGAAIANVVLPATLSDRALIGRDGFDANCAACHGTNGSGRDGVAPPLVHKIYEPNHHGDESFQRAVALGVRGHHWPFGDMPAVQGVSRDEVNSIIAYVRELQIANGIN